MRSKLPKMAVGKLAFCVTSIPSGGSRIFKKGRLIEQRGTNGRIATAHGHAAGYSPSVCKGEAATPSAPPTSATVHPLRKGTSRPQSLDSAAIKHHLRDYKRI